MRLRASTLIWIFGWLVILQSRIALAQNGEESGVVSGRPGFYIPELHGAQRGKYVRDDSGKYRHQSVPYDGGYGDRGLKYLHAARGGLGNVLEDFKLGPKDHLRFMIDFNFNGTGWQIIEFDWVRDDDANLRYNYLNENRLWGDQTTEKDNESSADSGDSPQLPADIADEVVENGENYAMPNSTGDTPPEYPEENIENRNVHVEGEYDEANIYNVTYNDKSPENVDEVNGVRDAIWEVLEYVQAHILPTLP